MDDKKLNTFLLIAEKKSLRQAADEAGYSQSALSQMLRSMEEELGVTLIERRHDGVRLTEAGEQLMPRIRAASRAVAQLKKEAEALGEKQKLIRIGTFSSLSRKILPMLVAGFQKEHPDVSFDIRIGGRDLVKAMQVGELDAVIMEPAMGEMPGIRIPMFDDDYCAVVPDSFADSLESPVSMEALQEYPFILPAESEERKSFHAERFKRTISVKSMDDHSVISMVSQGIGVTVVPRASVPDGMEGVRVLEIDEPWQRHIALTYSEEAGAAVRQFAAYVKCVKWDPI